MQTLTIDEHQIFFDDEFANQIQGKNWSVIKVRNVFYARLGRTYMHRLVKDACRGQIVDHINGNGLDNRLENLRFTSAQGNRANTHHGEYSSKYVGVSVLSDVNRKKRFRVQAKVNGKKAHLGYFETEEAAARHYDQHARSTYGDTAILNFQ